MGRQGLSAVLRISRQGSCWGLVSALGESLAGALRVSSARSLAGASWASSARSLTVVLPSGSHLGFVGLLSTQRSACHHAGASRALVPTLSMVSELSGSRVTAMLALGELPQQDSCRGCVGRPGKGLAGGKPILLFDLLAPLPWRCYDNLALLLPSSALLSVVAGVALTACAQVKGYKREPLLLCAERSPKAWPTHKRDVLLG